MDDIGLGRCRDLAAPFATALLQWYALHGRRLPWRETHSPYGTWISEIMLQQTQVTTVIPYYHRFLARFPDVRTLAASDLSDLLKLWQGLGYYSRARHLHAAAREIVRLYGGEVPHEPAPLAALPGIGEYTAGAILSIAFNQDYVAVDGNVKRILARFLDYGCTVNAGSSAAALGACARALLPAGRAGAFNQALMDLGATVCVPRQPLCEECPVAALCLARANGTQELRPVRSPRRPVPLREMAGALISDGDGRWLAVHRKPHGLLGGLWEIPAVQVASCDEQSPERTLVAALADALALAVCLRGTGRVVTHAYTHFRVRLTVFSGVAANTPILQAHDTWDDLCWLDNESMATHALTGLTLKTLSRAEPGSGPGQAPIRGFQAPS